MKSRGASSRSPFPVSRAPSRCSRKGVTLVEIGVVLFVIATMMLIVTSFLRSIALLRTTKDEAKLIKEAVYFARRSARKSSRPVYMEFDIDEDRYRVTRYDRTGEEARKVNLLGPVSLSNFNSLVSIRNASGVSIHEGKVEITFDPYGNGEEMMVYLGDSGGAIRRSIHMRKYGEQTDILQGEADLNLEKPDWREDLESW